MKKEQNLKNNDFLEIQGKNLSIKVPNNRTMISRAKRILEVYEEELQKEIPQAVIPELPKIPASLNPSGIYTRPETPIVEQAKSEELETPIEEYKEVEVKPEKLYTLCPLCKYPLKKKKVVKNGEILMQKVICKNKACNFERDYIIHI